MQFWVDVSCGWSSPDPWLWSGLIDSTGEGYDLLDTTITYGSTPVYTDWKTRPAIHLITGSDTADVALNDFYDQKGDTVTYLSRRYYVDEVNERLYMDDLVNSVYGIYILDLSSIYDNIIWLDLEQPLLQIYHVQWTKVSGQYVNATADFEALNDPGFEPMLVMNAGGSVGKRVGITASLLGYPNLSGSAEDEALAWSGFLAQRYYFRGIHPKAEKR
jgi:hypothetical protein